MGVLKCGGKAFYYFFCGKESSNDIAGHSTANVISEKLFFIMLKLTECED